MEYSLRKFDLDKFDNYAVLETGYIPPRNLRPYHTVERAFYGRDANRGLSNMSQQAKDRYAQRRESYKTMVALLKKYNLNRSLIVVKKNPDTTWLNIQPAGINIEGFGYDGQNHTNALFSYDIVDQAVDTEYVYESFLFNIFDIKDTKQVKKSYQFGEFRYYDLENTENILKMIVQMRDITQSIFTEHKVRMSNEQFASILTLAKLANSGWVYGSPRGWVRYMVKGFTLHEIIYAFNHMNKPEGAQFRPTPMPLVREYMQLPDEWVRSLAGALV